MGSFIDNCVAAVPAVARAVPAVNPGRLGRLQGPGGLRGRAALRGLLGHGQSVPASARPDPRAGRRPGHDPDTTWTPALGAETEKGSQVAETTTTLLGRRLRLHAIITNVAAERMTAAEVEAHHRLRGGIPEDTIRALKNDSGMIQAPVQSSFDPWPQRPPFLNVAARLVRHGRRLPPPRGGSVHQVVKRSAFEARVQPSTETRPASVVGGRSDVSVQHETPRSLLTSTTDFRVGDRGRLGECGASSGDVPLVRPTPTGARVHAARPRSCAVRRSL